MGKSHEYAEVEMEKFDRDSDDDISLHIRPKVEAEPTTMEIIKAILMYSMCSASLLLMNKMVIAVIPLHSYVSCAQFLFASVCVVLFKLFGWIELNYFNPEAAKVYMIYVFTFILGLYSNFRALETSNIETVIVFRACTPLCVSVLDYFFLGRQLPSRRSLGALLVIVIGALGYVMTDAAFQVGGIAAYTWVIVWFTSLCFNMTYGKVILKQVKGGSTWDSVYYTNLLSLLPMFLFGTIVAGEWTKKEQLELEAPQHAYFLLFLSCIAGLGIGYSGWKCRELISPTSYTLVGVINKILTVFLSLLLTDDNATLTGIFCLIFAISGSAFYKQPPLRSLPPTDFSEDSDTEPFKK